ncbi:hypothetical protein [Hymenobacter properus]|uniref:Lipoprotein n=1 Tax=Hymenobacter properus TaxID=2791026 RepID=A0A931BFX6_9BACT|nr:hypothetical protein [Hymenobacter properus]MBF9140557.1 hypothetical protein [Hymenobacter properus]MBR7719364.1 hypothetical protein [Microvirga sp. SRT04]
MSERRPCGVVWLSLLTLLTSWLAIGCSHLSRRAEKEGQPVSALPAPSTPAPRPAKPGTTSLPEKPFSSYRDTTLLFGKYVLAHDDEGYASVFYKPYSDSAWVEIPQVYGRSVELDTANVDRQGEPELLLTIEYKRSGNPDYGIIRTLHILRTGPIVDSLLAMRVGCANYHHSWEDGELNNFEQTQQVTAGYGVLRIGPVRTTCERNHSTAPCECDAQDLREAGGAPFARPGHYYWQHDRLALVRAR